MADQRSKFDKAIMYFSLEESENREFAKYTAEYNRLNNMSARKLAAIYVDVKSRYAHKKSVFSIFVATILIAILVGVWKEFGILLKIVSQMFLKESDHSSEFAKFYFYLIAGIVVILVISIVIVIVINLKSVRQLYKELLIIEEVRKNKQI